MDLQTVSSYSFIFYKCTWKLITCSHPAFCLLACTRNCFYYPFPYCLISWALHIFTNWSTKHICTFLSFINFFSVACCTVKSDLEHSVFESFSCIDFMAILKSLLLLNIASSHTLSFFYTYSPPPPPCICTFHIHEVVDRFTEFAVQLR